jgi:chemosensory pili system protein ChpA (sensor histidine kinase/response regulator)
MKAMAFDYSTLHWVKGEIEESLNQAREALEAYVATPADTAQMRFCANHLHQVRGTLQMIELYGASLLAEEIEQLAYGLANGEARHDNETYEVLMRGILQLPSYLEKMQTGQPDNPIGLLPILNDLRAARKQNLLSESALFNPDLSVVRPRVAGFEANLNEALVSDVDIRSVARKLRPYYQRALVNWHRDTRDVEQVKRLLKAVNQLEDVSYSDALGQLWWVAGGVLEALIAEGLQPSVSIELLMGKIDRQIKRLIEVGEMQWAAEPAKELIKNLLYYVAQARPQGARVVTLKQAFRLDEILPVRGDTQSAEALVGPSLELMGTVSAVIKEDLARVKDSLDIFVRSEIQTPEDLAPVQDILRRTADTLGMLGMGVPRGIVLDQVTAVQKITQSETAPSEAELMKVAGALLEVESALDQLGREAAGGEHDSSTPFPAPDRRLSDTEYRHLLAAVIKEAKADMSRIKDAITGFIVQPMQHDLLADVPRFITQIMGSLRMLDQSRAAALLERCKKDIIEQLLEKKNVPDAAQLDKLADIISSIEYYLEAVDEDRPGRESLLDLAEQRLAHFVDRIADAGLRYYQQDETHVPQAPTEPTQPAPDIVIRRDDIDQEIIDIFLDEARGELASMAKYFPAWQRNPEDRQALITVRRSFHTLKGSGRMVGAVVIGEFSWSLEKMLNKVLEGTLKSSPELFGLVEEAQAVLPVLIKSFEAGTAPTIDVGPLMERAKHVTEGLDSTASVSTATAHSPLPVPDVELVASEQAPVSLEALDYSSGDDALSPRAVSAAQPVEPGPSVPSTRMDPVLLEIFTKEVTGHLASVWSFIQACERSPGSGRITEALMRTVHTLHGSAAMAGVAQIAQTSALLEKYIRQLNLQDTILSVETITVLRDSAALIEETMVALRDLELAMPDASVLLGTISKLYELSLDEHPDQKKKEINEPLDNAQPADKDNEIVAIFLEEAREILDASDIVLQQWFADQNDNKLLEELQRQLHTLKGGARMAGIGAIGDLSHSLESTITALAGGDLAPSSHLQELLHRTQDRLVEMVDSIARHVEVRPAHDLIALMNKMVSPGAQEVQQDNVVTLVQPYTTARTAPSMPTVEQLVANPDVPSVEATGGESGDRRQPTQRPQSEQVRVRAELLDSLVNYAAEISISRSRIEQQVGAFKFNLEEMDEIVSRLRGQLRKLDIETEAQILFRHTETAGRQSEHFDPLEFDRFSFMQQLSRSLLESVNDLESVEDLLKSLTRESETLLLQQSRVNADLHEGLMRTRMVQFAVLMPRLRRIVRQTSQELDKKQVDLRVQGAEGEMDRTVLDRIMPSLEHILRNAIDHGIENAAIRRATDKPETGVITLKLAREGSEVLIQISDDGAGLDMQAIRSKAVERGLLDDSVEVSDKDLAQFILEPGFSTVEEITQISGRGVGMDVVNSEVKQLGGTLQISSVSGSGTSFAIRLPLSVSISRALLVRAGGETYAIPLVSIGRVVQIAQEELEEAYANDTPTYISNGQIYHILHLSTALGETCPPASGEKKVPVLLTQVGDQHIAVQVDTVLGGREIVVKSVGPQLSTLRGITGATILGDGSVVLILDINTLVRAGMDVSVFAKESPIPAIPLDQITAMVVDDSITVRKVTARLLERHNIQVLTAKDGVDALALLQQHSPDIMLLDIEMPRMDGFELATHMRNEGRLRGIPIIMITSRTGQKHRDRAMQIGVDKYMGKPFQEKDLLKNIEALTGRQLETHH